MGAVYRAFDINLGVAVAVKENLFTTAEYSKQFQKEALILATLRHPNLPRVTDHFVIEGEGQYLVMDFIEGEDLRERLEREGPVFEQELLPWFMEICDALAYLHSRQPTILHRDIKPGNIKIMPDGKAILVDFGLAKIGDGSSATTTGAKAMTPGFSPPEQYGTGRTDPRTDVYSLGATIYATLTATIPEDSLERMMGRDELTPLRKRNPSVSLSLSRVVEKALTVRPEDRYQTMSEFASALNAASRASRPTMIREYPYLQKTVRAPGKTVVTESKPESVLYPVKPKRNWAVIAIPVVAFSMIVAGTFIAIPDFPDRVAALFAPPTLPPMEEEVLLPASASESPQAPVVVEEPATPTATAELLVTATPLENPGVEPTFSPTPPPTPVGGGVGQIAFASNRTGSPQIFLMNVDGTGVTQLTNLPDGACQPSWAPDGQQLVFTSPCTGNKEVYPGASLWVLDLENVEATPIETVPGGDYDPTWSPAGDRIAFTSEREGRPQIHILTIETGEVVNLSDIFAREGQVTWSPANTQLIYVSFRTGNSQIWLQPDFGGDAQRFAWSETEDTHPSWSSDGQLVVFQRQIGGIPRLVAAQYEDRGLRDFRVCQQSPLSGQPMAEASFSPDGRWIVFETWPDGTNHNIALITTSCTNYTELTTDPALDFDAAWRP
jgi:serine/threonine protein kinase/Tol biopolymer transport system component